MKPEKKKKNKTLKKKSKGKEALNAAKQVILFIDYKREIGIHFVYP